MQCYLNEKLYVEVGETENIGPQNAMQLIMQLHCRVIAEPLLVSDLSIMSVTVLMVVLAKMLKLWMLICLSRENTDEQALNPNGTMISRQ